MRFSLLLTLVLLVSSCSPKWINGGWQGTGYQIDGQTWEVQMFADWDTGFEITYPDLSCGGVWDLTNQERLRFFFEETIEYGQDNCDQGVEVQVKRLSKDQIKVTYWMPDLYPNKPVATAELTRMEKGLP